MCSEDGTLVDIKNENDLKTLTVRINNKLRNPWSIWY
jgi:hypothetical protein